MHVFYIEYLLYMCNFYICTYLSCMHNFLICAFTKVAHIWRLCIYGGWSCAHPLYRSIYFVDAQLMYMLNFCTWTYTIYMQLPDMYIYGSSAYTEDMHIYKKCAYMEVTQLPYMNIFYITYIPYMHNFYIYTYILYMKNFCINAYTKVACIQRLHIYVGWSYSQALYMHIYGHIFPSHSFMLFQIFLMTTS